MKLILAFLLGVAPFAASLPSGRNAIEKQSVPQGFEVFGHYGTDFATRKTYYVSSFASNSSDFPEICIDNGFTPFQLTTAQEQRFFFAGARAMTSFTLLVGARKMVNDWVWRSHNELFDYPIHWLPGFPSNSPIDNCLSIFNGHNDGSVGFVDTPCDAENFFLCEKIGGLHMT